MTKFEKALASAKDAVVIRISSFVIRHYTTTFWKYSRA